MYRKSNILSICSLKHKKLPSKPKPKHKIEENFRYRPDCPNSPKLGKIVWNFGYSNISLAIYFVLYTYYLDFKIRKNLQYIANDFVKLYDMN